MKNDITVKFTKEREEELMGHVKGRNTKYSTVSDKRINECYTNEELHEMGVFSEAAVAEELGGNLNTDMYPAGGDRGKYDLLLPIYGRSEVKCVGKNFAKDPWLKEVAEKADKNKGEVDTYILTSYDFETKITTLEGWISYNDFVNRKTVSLFKNGPVNYTAKKKELNPFPQKKKMVSSITDTPKTYTTARYNFISDDIKIGDVVVLKTGGPDMTITLTLKNTIECSYFIGDNLQVKRFNPLSLVKKP